MIYLIIYLIGFIAVWFLLKWWRNKNPHVYDSWGDIAVSFIFSLFSWLGFIVGGIIILRVQYDKDDLPKPPKWL